VLPLGGTRLRFAPGPMPLMPQGCCPAPARLRRSVFVAPSVPPVGSSLPCPVCLSSSPPWGCVCGKFGRPAADSRSGGTHRERKADNEATHTGGDRTTLLPRRTSLHAGREQTDRAQTRGHRTAPERSRRGRRRGGGGKSSRRTRGGERGTIPPLSSQLLRRQAAKVSRASATEERSQVRPQMPDGGSRGRAERSLLGATNAGHASAAGRLQCASQSAGARSQ
jgi:hypothetical protein